MNAKKDFSKIAGALTLAAAFTVTAAMAQSASVDRRLAALGYSKAEIVDVVPDQIVTSWDYLDAQNVLVHRDTERHYLVTLSGPCPALATSSLISFNAANGGLGSSGTLRVGSGNYTPECGLGSIIRLNRTSSFASHTS
ncbi:DUF6491 family protein [Panacagrimonas sp.]|uniref:DUF6491 family protein n=1 Tax=Panacagrimonas sp. TaxID=2480088 RepID=UPI003B52515E